MGLRSCLQINRWSCHLCVDSGQGSMSEKSASHAEEVETLYSFVFLCSRVPSCKANQYVYVPRTCASIGQEAQFINVPLIL